MSRDNSKKVIVTGGCGFIGSHLVERLLKDSHQVTVIDNLATGKKHNLTSVLDHPKLKIICKDITNYNTIVPHFKDQDWVFHFSALADIVPSIDNPRKYYESNVEGTLNVLEACREMNVKRILYAASSSCYGIPEKYPTSEKSPIQPQYPYALTKFLGEQLLLHWGKVYALSVVSLRLFNVYGPRARSTGQYGAVFGVFLAQKLANKPLTIVGDGTQTRDFTYVSDVVNAFIQAAQSGVEGVFNVGSGGSYSVNELADMLGGKRVFIPKRPGEPDCTLADITKIKKRLKWEPKVSFQAGVKILIAEIESWKDAPVWTPESIKKATHLWFKYLRDSQ